MVQNESSLPYVATIGILVGLAVLLFGVEHHSYSIQGVGGAVILVGTFALAIYLDRLPGEAH